MRDYIGFIVLLAFSCFLLGFDAAIYVDKHVVDLAEVGVDHNLDAIHASEEGSTECTTDSECIEQCPEESKNLRPDDPEYCDGGPQS